MHLHALGYARLDPPSFRCFFRVYQLVGWTTDRPPNSKQSGLKAEAKVKEDLLLKGDGHAKAEALLHLHHSH